MDKYKVRFSCNYLDDKQLYIQLLNQHIVSDEYCFLPVLDKSFDYLIVFNYTAKKYLPSRTLLFIQEPSWSNCINVEYIDKWISNTFFHDKNLLKTQKSNIIESRTYLPYSSALPLKDLLNKKIVKEKRMSYVVSGISGGHNYDFRQELIQKILDTNLQIDIYGRGLTITDRRFKGPLENKFDGLEDYEFSIAIENSCEKNYLTEKFTDCILSSTVPVYYGAPNVSELYPEKTFISLDRSNSIDHLSKIYFESKYEDFSNNLKKARNHLVTSDNVFNKINEWLIKNGTQMKERSFMNFKSKLFKYIYFFA